MLSSMMILMVLKMYFYQGLFKSEINVANILNLYNLFKILLLGGTLHFLK